MIVWLLLGVLLLPTLFAVLARMLARRGAARGAALAAGVGFAGCVVCVAALRWLPIELQALGPLQLLVPSSEIVVAREAFLDPRAAGANSSDQVSNSGRLASPTLQPVPELTATPLPAITAQPTPRPEPTAAPTSLPEPTAAPAGRSAPTGRPKPTPEPEPAEPQPEPRAEPERYVVEPGDSLRGIAALYDVDAAELQRYNGLSNAEADSLQIGQVLFIPPSP